MSNSHGNRVVYRCDRCGQTKRANRDPGLCPCGRPFSSSEPCPRPFDPALILDAVNRDRAPWRQLNVHELCEDLGVSDRTWRLAAADWLTDVRADRWAIAAGLHPWEVWPDWIEIAMEHTDRAHVAIWTLRELAS